MPSPDAAADALLGGRVRLFQPAAGYRVAIDPVLLAAAVDPGDGATVLDLGSGTGAAALCLAARLETVRVTGLEADPGAVDAARRGAVASGLDARVAFLAGDVAAPPAVLAPGSFDQVIANPPYLAAGTATRPPDGGKDRANVEGAADLSVWIATAARLLRPRGRLAVVHRADRFDALVRALAPRFGSVELVPLWPRAGEAARRVIVRARLGGRSPARLSAGLVLHAADGSFTPAAEAILRGAAALEA
ncbi:MAG: tRNA1(Val) (adenine(37)-N6)-methyltransferase [Rhodospirillales bacterium]|jgi:tRNA1(Val) A37 N6-methylase TrmN6